MTVAVPLLSPPYRLETSNHRSANLDIVTEGHAERASRLADAEQAMAEAEGVLAAEDEAQAETGDDRHREVHRRAAAVHRAPPSSTTVRPISSGARRSRRPLTGSPGLSKRAESGSVMLARWISGYRSSPWVSPT